MKGIILLAGSGTRLKPTTLVINKHMLPIYNKPMFFYPLGILTKLGIKDALFVVNEEDEKKFKALLKNNDDFRINISYVIQKTKAGIVDAMKLCENFVGDDEFTMILGDNMFFDLNISEILTPINKVGRIFYKKVPDVSQYGCLIFDEMMNPKIIIEKPDTQNEGYAVTGLYKYTSDVFKFIKEVYPSYRNEYEISDLNNVLLRHSLLDVSILSDNVIWFDTGNYETLYEASSYVKWLEQRKNH